MTESDIGTVNQKPDAMKYNSRKFVRGYVFKECE
jgi:hypothetical protein